MSNNVKLVIKNDYTSEVNLKIIKMALQELKLSMDEVDEITIINDVINIVKK